LNEFEERFAILERIPYKEIDLLLPILGQRIGKDLVTVRSGRKIPNRWKSSFSEGSIIMGRIMRINDHSILTGVIKEEYVPENYGPYLVLALEIMSKMPSLDRSLFPLLQSFLRSEKDEEEFDKFLVSFMIKESLQPSLNNCVVCGNRREGFPIEVSVYLGGYVCSDCGSGEVELSEDDYESLLRAYKGVGKLTDPMRDFWLDCLESQLNARLVSREGL
jgi:DNA repair protein RecO (recombination protein O)